MIKRQTLRKEVLEDLHISLVFKRCTDSGERGIRAIVPEIVKGQWKFASDRTEQQLAGLFGGLSHEYITHNRPPEEVADKFVILMKRAVDGFLIQRVED